MSATITIDGYVIVYRSFVRVTKNKFLHPYYPNELADKNLCTYLLLRGSLIVVSERDKAWVFFEEFDPGSG